MCPDEALRILAERQHSLVSLAQARALLSHAAVRRRLAGPAWTLVTPRVMRLVGSPPTVEQPIMAATLDGGPGTVASYTSAAWLWRLPGFAGEVVEVSRARGVRSRPPGIGRLHLTRRLPRHHVTEVRAIPVTTLPRTLFDLAGHLPPRRTERLIDTVAARSPGTLRALHAMLEDHAERGRNGIAVVRAVLDARPQGIRREESGLERRVTAILERAGEPPLRPQVDVGGHDWLGRVDFTDALAPGVLYEIDSRLHHSTLLDRRNDAIRDAMMQRAGFIVVRIAEEDVWSAPWKVVETVRRHRQAASAA